MKFKPLIMVLVSGMIFALSVSSRAQAQDSGEGVSRFDRVAVMTSLVGQERKGSTAFFVTSGDDVLLLSTKHSALETNLTTEIALPSKGSLRVFRLSETTRKQGTNPWVNHGAADVAFCELNLDKLSADIRDQVEEMSISKEQFDRSIPLRSQRIEAIGFPMGLGITSERISPLATTCFVASEELQVDGTWGKESVYFASPAVGAGTSGGIAASHNENPYECKVVGMFIGFNIDNSGAKLSRFLPAHVLLDFIESRSE